MYHRFEENKYPSTNIKMDVFKKHMEIIKNNNFEFFDPKDFEKEFYNVKINKKILITIDDAFLSFYNLIDDVGAVAGSITVYIIPIFSTIFGFTFLNETTEVIQLVGIFIVIFSAFQFSRIKT